MKLNYIIIPLIMIIVSSLGSLLTSGGMDWYQTLSLPKIAPPGFVIGAVWTIIFVLTTISALLVWNHPSPRLRMAGASSRSILFKWIVAFFLVNAFLNVFWSFLFFTHHLILLSIIEMIILDLTVVALIILIWPIYKLAASLLIPYAVWVAFATFLAYNIYLLNPQK